MTKNFAFDDILKFITLAYYKLSEPYHNSFKEVLSPLQFYTLCVIKFNEKITMTRLSLSMKMPKQNMTKIVDKLIELNFVRREKYEADKRIINISITPEGNEFLINNAKVNAKRVNDIIIELGNDEATKFYDAINVINHTLELMT